MAYGIHHHYPQYHAACQRDEELKEQDFEEALELIRKVFDICVAPDYSTEGISKYYSFVNLDSLQQSKNPGYVALVAKLKSKIIGIIGLKEANHITIFFVDTKHQNNGTGRKLLNEAINNCRKLNKNLWYIEVNSSPFAVKIYEKLGFRKISEEQEKFGIKFTPMQMKLR